MNKALMQTWLDALRSGKYTQTTGTLYNGESHCCLGVADQACFNASFYFDDFREIYNDDEGFNDILPPDREEALGLDEPITADEAARIQVINGMAHVRVRAGFARMTIMHNLNDSAGFTFKQIADFVEEMGWDA